MSKTLKEAPLTTRNARAKLPIGLHWRGIDQEVHLGYRKGARGANWLVRWRNGVGYRQLPLGTADDEIAEGTLTFADAVKAGRERVAVARREARAVAEGPAQTVRSAVLAYMAVRDERDTSRKGRPVRSDAAYRLERYVVGRDAKGRRKAIPAAPLADIALHALDESALLIWRDGLTAKLKGATRQRLVNDLKAALNAAWSTHRRKLPSTLPGTVQHGLGAIATTDDQADPVARENQILSDSTVSAVIAAARLVDDEMNFEGDLYRLIVSLAATGARFSQATRLKVGGVQAEWARILMPVSRKGKGVKSSSTTIQVGQDVLEALAPAMAGRAPGEMLLMRWHHDQPRGSIKWRRTERGPWKAAAEIVRPWAAIRAKAGLSAAVVPYALRHSSIVRGIRAGLPIQLVAKMHDTSVQMIERHYGRWIADGLEDLAARAVVPLVPAN
jgi:integrase